MKIRMLEYFQGVGQSGLLLEENITVTIFEPGDVLEVNKTLGTYLIDNRKAVEVEPKQYGAKVVTKDEDLRELRHDDEVTETPAPPIELVEEPKPRRRSRK